MKKFLNIRRLPYKGKGITGLLYGLWTVLVLFIFAMSSQMAVNFDPLAFFAIGFQKILLEMAITAGVCTGIYVLLGRLRVSVAIGTALLMLLSLISSYVFIFRGTELMPLDFVAAGTAANVAGEYSFLPTPMMVGGLLLWILVLVSGRFLPKIPEAEQKHTGRKGWMAKLLPRFAGLAILAILVLFWAGQSRNIYIETWANNGSKYNGYLLNFTLQMRSELASHKPDGYSLEKIRELEQAYGEGETATGAAEEKPDIILLLEESFVDFRKLGSSPETKKPIIPFWDSLGENATKGFVLASVFGGGTANSEYEVLTGNTMGFLPHGATPYQLYIQEKAYAMPAYLKSLGYSCHATHPYLASGWNRPKIYPLLGFEDSTFLDDYPQKDLIRDYVSDREMFDYVIKRYEQRDTSKPFFLYGITMQNHGGYDYEGEGLTPRMEITGSGGQFPKAEQYFGLIHESDQAIKGLLEYFSKADHPVVVAIFGDHYPWVEIDYYEKLHGGGFDTLDDQQLEYSTPFVVWTNYDSPEKKVELTSLSNLSSLIYEKAKLPQPSYNRFLKDFAETIPAWNSQGFYSKIKGGFEYYDNAEGKEKEQLDRYSWLQYNSLFDSEGRSRVFFPIE